MTAPVPDVAARIAAIDADAIRRVVHQHAVWAFCGSDTACACDQRWRTNHAYHEHLIAALAVVTSPADGTDGGAE